MVWKNDKDGVYDGVGLDSLLGDCDMLKPLLEHIKEACLIPLCRSTILVLCRRRPLICEAATPSIMLQSYCSRVVGGGCVLALESH